MGSGPINLGSNPGLPAALNLNFVKIINQIIYMKKVIISQFVVLLVGTLFAWTNFAIELFDWMNNQVCATGCSVGLGNPFLSPCFGGAIFFTVAFILNIIILKKK